MNFKKTIAAGLSAAVLVSSGLTVSAAEKTPVNTNDLIINVEAYKAAYPDLAQAFGDNTDAYVAHYLTIGVYEGRTKGVLFDPLTYAEAYSDIKNAYGYDIPAIVNHYVTCGITENRTMGTSHGYADIATAESAGMGQYYLPRENTTTYADNSSGSSNAGNAGTGYTVGNSTGNSSSSSTGSSTGSSVSDSAAAYNNAAAAAIGSAADRWQAHHTTTILHDDGSKWRVEYYDENNNLKQYSSITYTDTSTDSYTETVYSYDKENKQEIVERTDTYVNGTLESSTSGN